ncbi:M23 family metallopeptidase [Microbacterium oxydans]|uniref:M23 family metallopeptidase n=1 Tax=Microbacterium oxydans TaxID=82380 RepID=UPI0007345778|nr:M23 family metallopeptidase [Microbacterium oxydans]
MTDIIWPNGQAARPNISSPFGPRPNVGAFSFHYGTDFTGFTAIRAVMPGLVTFAGWMNASAGNTIVIDHGGGLTSVYMHNLSHAVKRGERVRLGQQIAIMGRTGNASGNCCHLEIRRHGTSIDPVPYISERLGSPASGGGGIEIVMDKETFINYLWEFFKYRSRDGGPDGSGEGYKKGATAWERLNSALASLATLTGLVNPDENAGGKGWLPFRNAMSRWLIYHSRIDGPEGKGATLHERLDQIESAVRAGGDIKLTIDAGMLAKALADPKVAQAFAAPIAKAVNDDVARRMEK